MTPPKSSEKGTRWRELKRELMLEAALARIAAEGVGSFTIESVADEAGVAKGTIYLYFESKRELVEEAIAHSLDPLVDRVSTIMESTAEPVEKLRRMAEANLEYFDQNRRLFRVHLDGPFFPHTQSGRLRERGYRTVLGHVTRVIGEGIESGTFRRCDPPIAAAIWLESLTAFILRRLREERRGAIADEVDALLDVVLHGLAAPAAG